MKIDQTHLTPVGAVPPSEGPRAAAQGDPGASKKKIADAPQGGHGHSIATHRSEPIILDNKQVRLRFNKDEETGVEVIQVVDADSGKLVRQIPPKELLDIAKALRDLKGLIVSKES